MADREADTRHAASRRQLHHVAVLNALTFPDIADGGTKPGAVPELCKRTAGHTVSRLVVRRARATHGRMTTGRLLIVDCLSRIGLLFGNKPLRLYQ